MRGDGSYVPCRFPKNGIEARIQGGRLELEAHFGHRFRGARQILARGLMECHWGIIKTISWSLRFPNTTSNLEVPLAWGAYKYLPVEYFEA